MKQMFNFLGIVLCYILAAVLIVSGIILVCGAIYAQDKANKKY